MGVDPTKVVPIKLIEASESWSYRFEVDSGSAHSNPGWDKPILEWCTQEFGDQRSSSWMAWPGPFRPAFFFTKEEDAMKFKLWWC